MNTTGPGVTYLDLDGDGVPDAVLTVETLSDPADGPEHSEHPTIVETLERGIGIDGRPREVQVLAHP